MGGSLIKNRLLAWGHLWAMLCHLCTTVPLALNRTGGRWPRGTKRHIIAFRQVKLSILQRILVGDYLSVEGFIGKTIGAYRLVAHISRGTGNTHAGHTLDNRAAKGGITRIFGGGGGHLYCFTIKYGHL